MAQAFVAVAILFILLAAIDMAFGSCVTKLFSWLRGKGSMDG